MKRIKTVIVVLILLVTVICPLTAQAITVDGIAENKEWAESKTYLLDEYKDFGNGIKTAYAMISIDEKSNCLYILVCSEFKSVNEQTDAPAMSLTVNDLSPVVAKFNSTFNTDFSYDGETKTVIDSRIKSCTTEMMIHFRQGFTEKNTIKLSLCDMDGVYSNEFVLEYDLNCDTDPMKEEKSSEEKAEKTKAPTKEKTKESKTDFPFKKVEATQEEQVVIKSKQAQSSSAQPQELNSLLQSKGGTEKLIYSVAGVFGALLVIGSAVLVSVKNSKKSQEKS